MLSRRQFLAGAAAARSAAAPSAPLNVLLVMTDQHRADAIGAYGNPVIRTPNLDRLAAGGARFTNCWTQHPVCMPSRASIFTGRYPSAHRVRTNGVSLPKQETTLAQVFLNHGYATFGAGKFHFIPHHPYRSPLPTMDTHPGPYYGFQEFHLGEDGRSGEHWMWIQKNYPQFHLKADHEIPLELHNSRWVADHTVRFLKESAAKGRPFFAFASFVDPHHSYNPPSPYREMYREADMPAPVQRAGELEDKPEHIRATSAAQAHLLARLAYHRTQYYGEVTFIDDSIGLILRALEDLKLRDNTLIVFIADHGDLLGDHSLFYKGPYHYRHCASVPLLIHCPALVRAGKVIEGIVQEIDVFPTITDLAGIPNPPGVQGRSQRAVLTTGSGDTGNDSALIEHAVSGAEAPDLPRVPGAAPDLWTLVTSKWRLSYYPALGAGELYDLESDPNEFVNRWADKGLARVRSQLKEQLLDRVLGAHDPLPVRERIY